ncbi:site-specific integrase [Luteibacter sp. NPDC031894]|uniref:site-specific integrase n=1 Tax=Luteibacter sp. NPDC031894 TaxID=3390572 RepID=UPI003D05B40F
MADASALMSDLHRVMEQLAGIDRRSLDFVMEQFEASEKFKGLAPATQAGYKKYRKVASKFPTAAGPLGTLAVRGLTAPLMQKIIDKIASQGTPTKANSLLRYLRRMFRWAKNRGFCETNPCAGLEQATERKRRRLPTDDALRKLADFALERGKITAHRKGALAPYLWPSVEIMYLCRLRGIEVITLMEDAELPEGLMTNRVKGSLDNIVAWTPRLRKAWDAIKLRRDTIWVAKRIPIPMHAKDRIIFVNQTGGPLAKSSFDSAFQRLMKLAIAEGAITEEQRFGPHDLKRKGITDTKGTRDVKQQASGHKSRQMMDVYDLEVPVVGTSEKH